MAKPPRTCINIEQAGRIDETSVANLMGILHLVELVEFVYHSLVYYYSRSGRSKTGMSGQVQGLTVDLVGEVCLVRSRASIALPTSSARVGGRAVVQVFDDLLQVRVEVDLRPALHDVRVARQGLEYWMGGYTFPFLTRLVSTVSV